MKVALLQEIITEGNHLFSSPEWCAQEKIDGMRMLVRVSNGVVTCYNRKEQEILTPSALMARLDGAEDMLIDGEWVAATSKFHPFDLLEYKGEDYTRHPYTFRLALMTFASISAVDTAFSEDEKKKMAKRVLANGGEGVVFKSIHSANEAGRSGGFKLKFYRTETFRVSSVRMEKLTVELERSGHIFGNVKFSFSKKWPKVGDLVEVRFDRFSGSGKLIRPVYLMIREDLDSSDIATHLQIDRDSGEE